MVQGIVAFHRIILAVVYTVRKALLDGLKSSCTTTSGWLWELALHVATKTDRIERIPRILAHRSMERYAAELGQAQNEMCRVMQHTFNKLGSNARIETPAWAIEHNRLVCQPRFPDQGPRVASNHPDQEPTPTG